MENVYTRNAQPREENTADTVSRWAIPALIAAAVIGLGWWALSQANNNNASTGATQDSTLNSGTPSGTGSYTGGTQ
jgi:hypothetical protein